MTVKRCFRSFDGKVRKTRGAAPLSILLTPEKRKQLRKRRREWEKMFDRVAGEARKELGM